MRTEVCVIFDAPTIACASIALAAERLGLHLPTEAPNVWWEIFGVESDDMVYVQQEIRSLYEKPKVSSRRRKRFLHYDISHRNTMQYADYMVGAVVRCGVLEYVECMSNKGILVLKSVYNFY